MTTTRLKLLGRKVGIAFLVGFLGVFIPAILQVFDALQKGEEPTLTNAFLISLISGAIAAGVRGVLAISPLNLGVTDGLTSLKNPQEETIVEVK
jgi:hypothetical protein